MDVQIVSIQFDTQVSKNGGGTYPGTEVIYKLHDGKVNVKGLHDNVFKYNAQLKEDLKAVKAEDYVRIETEKKGEFVNWKSVKKIDAPNNSPSTTPTQPTPPTRETVRSNYETPEERALKQKYIVRQSSITAALAYFALDKKGASPELEALLEVAAQFEDHVFREGEGNE